MIDRLKTFGEYILIGLFIAGLIVVYGVSRASVFNIYLLSIGIMLMIIPGVAVFLSVRAANLEVISDRMRLKKTGVRIPVDLTKCEIRANNWTTETERYGDSDILLSTTISGDADNHSFCRVVFKCDYNGKSRTFLSSPVEKDKVTVMLLFEMQKETAIYVDRNDDRYYYFDLEFLGD